MLKKSINTMIITMISRVLGLFRGTLVAYFFGASVLTDAYYSAFKISNFFRQLLGEGALGNTFIPLYHKKKKEEGEERSREYIFSVLNITFLFSFVISVLMIIFSSYIIDFIVVGFSEELKMVASRLLKIMSFYFLFISLSGQRAGARGTMTDVSNDSAHMYVFFFLNYCSQVGQLSLPPRLAKVQQKSESTRLNPATNTTLCRTPPLARSQPFPFHQGHKRKLITKKNPPS